MCETREAYNVKRECRVKMQESDLASQRSSLVMDPLETVPIQIYFGRIFGDREVSVRLRYCFRFTDLVFLIVKQ
jgi:hypothetical protein